MDERKRIEEQLEDDIILEGIKREENMFLALAIIWTFITVSIFSQSILLQYFVEGRQNCSNEQARRLKKDSIRHCHESGEQP